MNVSPRCWSPFHTNECVFSRNEQQKVYYKGNKWRCKESTIRGHRKSRLGLRFFPCPLMVDSLHLPLFPLSCLYQWHRLLLFSCSRSFSDCTWGARGRWRRGNISIHFVDYPGFQVTNVSIHGWLQWGCTREARPAGSSFKIPFTTKFAHKWPSAITMTGALTSLDFSNAYHGVVYFPRVIIEAALLRYEWQINLHQCVWLWTSIINCSPASDPTGLARIIKWKLKIFIWETNQANSFAKHSWSW